jgi:hypothetical protein
VLDISYDFDSKSSEINPLLFRLLSQWRHLFMLVGEINRTNLGQVEKNQSTKQTDSNKVELSRETREKLSNFVDSSIQKSLG